MREARGEPSQHPVDALRPVVGPASHMKGRVTLRCKRKGITVALVTRNSLIQQFQCPHYFSPLMMRRTLGAPLGGTTCGGQ